MRMSTLFGQNTSNFSKIMVSPHGQGGVCYCGHFVDKGEGVNFSRFSAAVLYGRPKDECTIHRAKLNLKMKT